jgi:hypothetical protein
LLDALGCQGAAFRSSIRSTLSQHRLDEATPAEIKPPASSAQKVPHVMGPILAVPEAARGRNT